MAIYMADNEVDHIWFYTNPAGTLYPPDYLKEPDLKLENFEWKEKFRPKTKEDIFIWQEDDKTEAKKGKNTENKSEEKQDEKK